MSKKAQLKQVDEMIIKLEARVAKFSKNKRFVRARHYWDGMLTAFKMVRSELVSQP